MKNTVLLIDAYAMIYRAYYAFINAPRVNSKGQNTSAIFGFVITLDDVLRRINPTHIAVAFDPKGGTFRHEAYEQYKAQREKTPEDITFAVPHIKRILAAMRIPCLEVAGFEADDVIGTVAHQLASEQTTVYMLTPDKDYGQLVTPHALMYRPRHKGGFDIMGPQEVCEKYGLQNCSQVIDYLALVGDKSDNIPGCPKVGEKTAEKLLAQFGTVDNLLAHTDQIQGAIRAQVEQHKDDIVFSKFLATIRTDVPLDASLDSLAKQEPDNTALTTIYRELEFRSLLQKITISSEKTAPAQSAEPDLFSALASPDMPLQTTQSTLNCDSLTAEALTEHHNRIAIYVSGNIMAIATSQDQAYHFLITDDGLVDDVNRLLLTGQDTLVVVHDIKNIIVHQPSLKFGDKVLDIMLAHYVLQPELSHDLDYLVSTLLGMPSAGAQQSQAEQACHAAAAILSLSYGLESAVESSEMRDLYWSVEMPLARVLARMELSGVRIDVDELRRSSGTMTERMLQLEREVQQLAGAEFNVASPKQVGEILFERLALDPKAKKTKKGQYVTSEEVLEPLRHAHPIVDKILDYRALKKLLSTYIDALPTLINPHTGKIHTSYNQAVTATGRLSSSNPNLQNIPVRTDMGREIRRAFVPDEGCQFVSFDYSQIELRLMAHLSGDPHMIAAFQSGEDIHAATAAKIFNIAPEAVTSDMRRVAKTANFGIIYGISAFGLAQRLGISRTEAKELINGYFASYPHIAQYIEFMKDNARKTGYVETMFHRRRYLPDINSRNATVRQFAERNAVNAPIQGSAADIIKIAMIKVDEFIEKQRLQTQMILQVHDELNFSVPQGEIDIITSGVRQIMESAVTLQVPLVVDCGTGNNWLEAH